MKRYQGTALRTAKLRFDPHSLRMSRLTLLYSQKSPDSLLMSRHCHHPTTGLLGLFGQFLKRMLDRFLAEQVTARIILTRLRSGHRQHGATSVGRHKVNVIDQEREWGHHFHSQHYPFPDSQDA